MKSCYNYLEIKSENKELGRPPKYDEVQQATTMAFRFGSWNKALEAAGLKAFYWNSRKR
ncbi:homing endonuclease associated repeat-containing protein [Bacillus subtilis]|uniref:homing endonuclease associated repeat-containing protein n=1 Tax=Bacillus subtilis TaxID=1423 RepID=UPI001CFBE86F|nr:hypothetical protein [Bacillus subtilis]